MGFMRLPTIPVDIRYLSLEAIDHEIPPGLGEERRSRLSRLTAVPAPFATDVEANTSGRSRKVRPVQVYRANTMYTGVEMYLRIWYRVRQVRSIFACAVHKAPSVTGPHRRGAA